jgi:hypothetical protein
MRWLAAILALFWGSLARAAVPPAALAQALDPLEGWIADAIAGDPALLRDVGAATRADLDSAVLAYDRAYRYESLDFRSLPRSADLQDALVQGRQRWLVPYCVASVCTALVLAHYDPDTDEAGFETVGRTLQAERLAAAIERLAKTDAAAAEARTVLAVASDDFLVGGQGAGAYLVPAGLTEGMGRLSFEDLRAYVARREAQMAARDEATERLAGDPGPLPVFPGTIKPAARPPIVDDGRTLLLDITPDVRQKPRASGAPRAASAKVASPNPSTPAAPPADSRSWLLVLAAMAALVVAAGASWRHGRVRSHESRCRSDGRR